VYLLVVRLFNANATSTRTLNERNVTLKVCNQNVTSKKRVLYPVTFVTRKHHITQRIALLEITLLYFVLSISLLKTTKYKLNKTETYPTHYGHSSNGRSVTRNFK